MKRRIFIALLIIGLIVISGCAVKVDANKVRSFADPMTENLLIAMNNKNYEMFSRDLDSKMKQGYT